MIHKVTIQETNYLFQEGEIYDVYTRLITLQSGN